MMVRRCVRGSLRDSDNVDSASSQLSNLLPLIPIPPTEPLVEMFQVKCLNNLNNPSDNELRLCDALLKPDMFPGSLWIMSLRACVLYHLHGKCLRYCIIAASDAIRPVDFGQAEAQFKKIWALDPHRIDDIDIYSNILYVGESKLELSKLAHEFLALDKDRPEVCCLVGTTFTGFLLTLYSKGAQRLSPDAVLPREPLFAAREA